jgi:hypothetical protein
MSWPDMAFCFTPGATHLHKDDVDCSGTQLWPNNIYIIIGHLLKQDFKNLMNLPFVDAVAFSVRAFQRRLSTKPVDFVSRKISRKSVPDSSGSEPEARHRVHQVAELDLHVPGGNF